MFELTLKTGNAAFEDDNGRREIARILRELADDIENGSTFDGRLRDTNGNTVGSWSIDEDRDA